MITRIENKGLVNTHEKIHELRNLRRRIFNMLNVCKDEQTLKRIDELLKLASRPS